MSLALISGGMIFAVLVVEVIQMGFDFKAKLPHQAACGCAECADLHGDQALSADEVELVNLRRRCAEQVAEIERLRADLAKAQAESEAAAKRWDEENASLAAQLAKAQARCAELERQISDVLRLENCINCICGRGKSRLPAFVRSEAHAALASDGTSALAAVRLAQRLVKMVTPPKERPADLGLNRREKLALEVEKALAEAFGSGE